MPELPEVEWARRAMLRWFDGHRLVRTEVEPAARTFRGADVDAFLSLRGRLEHAERRGKYLLLSFSQGRGLLLHLGMTGKLVRRPSERSEPYSRARFCLTDHHTVHFRDARRFGRIEPMAARAMGDTRVIAALGVDPLVDGLSVKQLRDAVSSSRQPLKVALMDQCRLAGLGNIHTAEALFRAGLHPARRPATLSAPEWTRLRRGIWSALSFALRAEQGREIRYVEESGSENPFLIYGRAGMPCPRCASVVQRLEQGGRTTCFCPKCQPARTRASGPS